jgi:hypothetical protein
MDVAASDTPSHQRDWSAADAFLGVMTLVAVQDVRTAETRMRAVHEFAERSPFLRKYGEQGLPHLQSNVVKCIDAAGCHALERACSALPAEMRESVYAACLDILAASGVLSDQDRVLTNRLRVLLQIEPVLARQIETVLLLKNRF